MTNLEKAIIHILKVLNLDKDSTIVIMLQLKDNQQAQYEFIEYLRNLNPTNVTQTNIFDKVEEITQVN